MNLMVNNQQQLRGDQNFNPQFNNFMGAPGGPGAPSDLGQGYT